jgi:uncharacterized cupredoxin-like copper-binding protein
MPYRPPGREARAMSTRSHRLLVTLAAVASAIALVPLAAAAPARPGRTAATTTIHVRAGDFFFRLSAKSVPRPGRVTFVVTNGGRVAHDFRIAGKTTAMLDPGKSARLTVTFRKKSRYPYLCTVPGHAAAGMKGVFIVR